MANELSQIKVGNTTYDIKDTTARTTADSKLGYYLGSLLTIASTSTTPQIKYRTLSINKGSTFSLCFCFATCSISTNYSGSYIISKSNLEVMVGGNFYSDAEKTGLQFCAFAMNGNGGGNDVHTTGMVYHVSNGLGITWQSAPGGTATRVDFCIITWDGA